MFLREKLESVRFMIIVTDPRTVSTREINVSREVTGATPLTCSARALLEMVQSKAIGPTPQSTRRPLIVEVADAERDTNAVVLESKDDKIDTVAKGDESKDGNVAKSESDEASG